MNCPYCDSEYTNPLEFQGEGEEGITVRTCCNTCKKEFDVIYDFFHAEEEV